MSALTTTTTTSVDFPYRGDEVRTRSTRPLHEDQESFPIPIERSDLVLPYGDESLSGQQEAISEEAGLDEFEADRTPQDSFDSFEGEETSLPPDETTSSSSELASDNRWERFMNHVAVILVMVGVFCVMLALFGVTLGILVACVVAPIALCLYHKPRQNPPTLPTTSGSANPSILHQRVVATPATPPLAREEISSLLVRRTCLGCNEDPIPEQKLVTKKVGSFATDDDVEQREALSQADGSVQYANRHYQGRVRWVVERNVPHQHEHCTGDNCLVFSPPLPPRGEPATAQGAHGHPEEEEEDEHLTPQGARVASAMTTSCDICLHVFAKSDVIAWSKNNQQCHHAFHEECITEWLMQNPTCPLCRQPYLSDGSGDNLDEYKSTEED